MFQYVKERNWTPSRPPLDLLKTPSNSPCLGGGLGAYGAYGAYEAYEAIGLWGCLLGHFLEGGAVDGDVEALALGGGEEALGLVVTLLDDGHYGTGLVGLGTVAGTL